MAFFLATVAEYGDDWPALLDRPARQRRQGRRRLGGRLLRRLHRRVGETGTRPIVVSYDSSPAFTVERRRSTTTAALLDTCFRQVEYAGVLAGADNPDGAEALIDFLLTDEVQSRAAGGDVRLPGEPDADGARPTGRSSPPQPTDPYEVAPERDRRQPRAVADRVDGRHLAGDRRMQRVAG